MKSRNLTKFLFSNITKTFKRWNNSETRSNNSFQYATYTELSILKNYNRNPVTLITVLTTIFGWYWEMYLFYIQVRMYFHTKNIYNRISAPLNIASYYT